MAGEVVGITTLYLKGGENLNFAIPVNDAKHLLSTGSKVQDFPVETSDPLASFGTPATPNEEPIEAQTQVGGASSSAVSPSAQNAPATIDQQVACRAKADIVLQEERQQWASPRDRYLIAFSNVTSRFEASTGTCYAGTNFIISVKNKNGPDGVITTTQIQDGYADRDAKKGPPHASLLNFGR